MPLHLDDWYILTEDLKMKRMKRLIRLFVNDDGQRHELRLDFETDRHHALTINVGDSREIVVTRLRELANNLERDKLLD